MQNHRCCTTSVDNDHNNISKKTQLASKHKIQVIRDISPKMIPWAIFDLDDGPKHASQGCVTSPSAKISSSIQTLDNAGG